MQPTTPLVCYLVLRPYLIAPTLSPQPLRKDVRPADHLDRSRHTFFLSERRGISTVLPQPKPVSRGRLTHVNSHHPDT